MRASNGEPPSTDSTPAAVSCPVAWARAWSSSDSASRAEPAGGPGDRRQARPARTRRPRARASEPSSPVISSIESSVSSKCCVRDRMVGSTFSGFVVASTNTTWPGGSSSVFSSAFDAAVDEHVHLVDEVHLRPSTVAPRPRLHALDEVADRVDAVVRRRVHLDEVVEAAGGDRDAVLARAVRLAVVAEVQAVERLGEDAGRSWSCPCRAARRRGRRGRPGLRGRRCAAPW